MSKATATGKSVLLYSGGVDSFITAHLWQPDILLYCAIGHQYEQKELDIIKESSADVIIDHRLSLADIERNDGIIPLRNLLLGSIASYYGDIIGFGVLKGEINGDKSHVFRKQLTDIFSTCYQPSYWSEGMEKQIVYPVSQYSKVELIAEYLKQGKDKKTLINKTRSCYRDLDIHCGHCSACLKRYIAFRLNGIEEEYKESPHTSPYLAQIRKRFPTFDNQRKTEILSVFPELEPDLINITKA